MMNIPFQVLLMSTLALAISDTFDTASGLNISEEADVQSGLSDCTQYKIKFNTFNCICNSSSFCIKRKLLYETNCINNC